MDQENRLNHREKLWCQGKRIKTVCMTPCFILKTKGKFAAKNLASVGAFINRLEDKLYSLENEECVVAEGILFPTRQRGANALQTLTGNSDGESTVSEISETMDPDQIRTIRSKNARKVQAKAAVSDAQTQIPKIYEHIVHIDTILWERIGKTRNLCYKKIMAYVEGVTTKQPFSYEAAEKNDAYTMYKDKHEHLDNALEKAVQHNNEVGKERDDHVKKTDA